MTTDADRSLIAHLLRRTGFGASGPEIDAALAAGFNATVDSLFTASPSADPGVAATPAPKLPSAIDTGADADLVAWWIARMTAARDPWPEKRTYFWHGHFATSLQKVRYASLMLRQNQTLRTLGGGDFHTLFRTILTDPAMMVWLDAEGSTAEAPNENLARESMELFGLGVGHYTETDVRQAALALTGWRLDRISGVATFAARNHAAGPETILGRTASFDADSFADLILAQPASAEFVVARHWFRLGSPATIPAATRGSLLAAYGSTGDLSALARALFTDPAFTGSTARYGLVKQPVEYVVGALRALKITPTPKDTPALRAVLDGLGQLPFYPPNVGGWPSGQLWLTTAALQARIDFARWAAAAGDLSTVSDSATGSRIDAVAYLLGVDSFSARTVTALSDVAADPPSLVELALLSPEYQVN
ncbi:DUF1800 domain-containing protein [Actinospica sp. MGRD01-02]|uniref:DUF1800 domain-containing protein n=1 Tax=Actinospica acidithermotolerans TaxID=2828514 RepID=A0A941IIF4_9ACTN|nr:DUF1800 domain-containing protein [Actinospica acidithermotolerans]MBR7826093.1 DUF1800 domain-containing protein [Actinospica acidithermotolerans]